MKKRLLTLSVALGLFLGLSVPVGAVELEPQHVGVFCENGYFQLHFVWNQVDKDTDYSGVVLTVVLTEFSDGSGGSTTHVLTPTKTNKGTVHYTLNISPTYPYLYSASNAIDIGKLVLSDAKCKKGSPVGLD